MFEAADPALEVTDLERIAAWFEALAGARLPRVATLTFIEPCLFESEDARWRVVSHLPFGRLAEVAARVREAQGRFPSRRQGAHKQT